MSSPTDKQTQQASYQQALIGLAYQEAAENLEEVGFDLRGRAIYTLELNEETLRRLAKAISPLDDSLDEKNKAALKEFIKENTGIEVAEGVRCALDLQSKVPLNELNIERFRQSLETQYQKTFGEERLSNLQITPETHLSVTALYEELLANLDHKHHAVITHLKLEKSDEKYQRLEDGYKKARAQIQEELIKVAEALEEERKAGTFTPDPDDFEELNKRLDARRTKAASAIEGVYTQSFEHLSEGHLQAITNEDFARSYETTAAHHHDSLGVDLAQGSINFISQSGERTSHNKHLWKSKHGSGSSAFRLDLKYQITKEGTVELYNGQAGGRVPSIANLKEKDDEKDVTEISKILESIYETLNAVKADNKPAVYNLLTSLHDDADLDDNKQNKSARRILLGAHQYNKTLSTEKRENFFWVQNIGVNHFTQDLDPLHANKVLAEASLMSEIALLYTLQNNSAEGSPLRTRYNEVVDQYREFLQAGSSLDYLHDSEQGKNIRKLIDQAREIEAPEVTTKDSPKDLVQKKLQTLYHNGDDKKEQYGNLVQALSIFIEEKYVSGCKSANERNEDVQKRVTALVNLDGKIERGEALGTEEEALLAELQETKVKCDKNKVTDKPITEKAEAIRHTLAVLTNKTNANGNSNAHSLADQGGPSKLQVTQQESLDKAKAMMRTATRMTGAKRTGSLLTRAAIIVGIGLLAAATAVATAFTGPIGLALGGAALYSVMTSSTVAGAFGVYGLAAGGSALSANKLGYDTNLSCEPEMKNCQNKSSSKLQSHNKAKWYDLPRMFRSSKKGPEGLQAAAEAALQMKKNQPEELREAYVEDEYRPADLSSVESERLSSEQAQGLHNPSLDKLVVAPKDEMVQRLSELSNVSEDETVSSWLQVREAGSGERSQAVVLETLEGFKTHKQKFSNALNTIHEGFQESTRKSNVQLEQANIPIPTMLSGNG
jgi:hypothetical protein